MKTQKCKIDTLQTIKKVDTTDKQPDAEVHADSLQQYDIDHIIPPHGERADAKYVLCEYSYTPAVDTFQPPKHTRPL